MSNKRIQKKRAKKREQREWERDRSKLIAEFLVTMYPGMSRGWYVRHAMPLLRMEKGPLLEYLMQENLRRSPFRRMIPRKSFDGELVNWRPITSMQETK